MAHRGVQRAIKEERRLLKQQEQAAQVYQFPVQKREDGNDLPNMSETDRIELETLITDRFHSASDTTDEMAREIDKAERQFKGIFPDMQQGQEFHPDDHRVFIKKTLENAQAIHAHMDSLTAQLDPPLIFQPVPSGIFPPEQEYKRAKLKEIIVNQILRDNKLKKSVLPRWRWNFLKHPSAYVSLHYENDPHGPDLKIEVEDRADLYIDPSIKSGNVQDAGWIIKRAFISAEEAQWFVDEGYWHYPDSAIEIGHWYGGGQNQDILARMLGQSAIHGHHRGPDRDRWLEVWHYWQAPGRGIPHAYGVMLGGESGRLVRYGPNPYPYKKVPFFGKAYLQDPYRPDGMSLAYQYRSIQEVYNTFFNLRIEDVLQGVKNQWVTFEDLFNETTEADIAQNKRMIRFNKQFMQQMLDAKVGLESLMKQIGSGESTQHLLQDLQYLEAQGASNVNASDVFRGQNPQSGATLGQVQEQLFRSLGVFRPIYAQEMMLLEELGEAINVYLNDPEFYGAERMAAIVGPNRYRDVIGMQVDAKTGVAAMRVPYDEMEVDITVEAVSQADHLASKTIRLTALSLFMESIRNLPEVAAEFQREVNVGALFMQHLQESGYDIEAIRLTPEQKKERADAQQQQRKQALEDQGMILKMQSQADGEREALREQARTQGKLSELQTKAGLDSNLMIDEIVAKHQATLQEMNRQFLHDIAKMVKEASLESAKDVEGVGHGSNINRS